MSVTQKYIDVNPLISGNPELFRIVEQAMLKYKCASLDFAVDVTQTFNFKK